MSNRVVNRRTFAALAALTAACATAAPALAIDRHWNILSGTWSLSADWSPAGVPSNTDNAIIDYFSGAPGSARVINFVASPALVKILNSNTVNVTTDGMVGSIGDFIVGGDNTGGTLHVTTGDPFTAFPGKVTVGATLRVGQQGGFGAVNQDAGTVSVASGEVFIGDSHNSVTGFPGVGTYNISGGVLSTNTIYVGNQFDPQTAGTFNISGGQVTGNITVTAPPGGAAGVVQQTGGLVNGGFVTLQKYTSTQAPAASYNLSGGTFVAARTSVTSGCVFNYSGGACNAGYLIANAGKVQLTTGGNKVLHANRVSTGYATSTPGVIDLADNTLVHDFTGAIGGESIASQLISGYNGGAWNGWGINSSTAAAMTSAAHKTALGWQRESDGSDTVRYTFYGDANLDRKVDLTDFTVLAANFNASNKSWYQGDYNYDGKVNLTDFTFLASNFNQSLPALQEDAASVVPEPRGIIDATVAAAAMAFRFGRIRKRARFPLI